MEHVEVARRDRVVIVTLVDRERRNAMSATMVDEVVATFDELEADDDVGAVVVTGAPPAFCSGADVSNLGRLSSDAGRDERTSIRGIYEGFLRILRCPLPTVAAVNGPAVGAGLNVALACDVRLAGEHARFDSRFVQIGLHPGGGHTWMLERLVGPQTAAAMVSFGEVLDAKRAVETGLAWSHLPDDVLLDAATALAARAAAAPRELAVRAKSTLRAVPWQPDFDAAVATEVEHQTWSFGAGFFRRRPEGPRAAPTAPIPHARW